MVSPRTQAAAALGLALASLLLEGALFARGVALPAVLELWFTALPGWAVRSLRPGGFGGLALVTFVLALQYFLLLAVLLRARGWLRARLPPAAANHQWPHRPNT